MSSQAVRTAPPPPLAEAAHWLVLRVCTSNPFYVVSAGLFLAGLYASFERNGGDVETWALLSGLGGYTLLLAGTAFLLVRFANAWDDLRTVLLLVVLMFLATSVTFDEVLVLEPGRGALYFLLGLAFAVIVSEGLLRGIRLRLPGWFRLPYYLILGLFFLYPLEVRALLDWDGNLPAGPQPVRSEALMWGLFAFAPVAGLLALTLLPAIRRGPAYVQGNGSPWRWPLYPWTLFGLLGLAVPGRAFLLCWSMDLPGNGDRDYLIFGPYFIVPFGLCATVLLLEIGLVGGHCAVQRLALAVPLGLALLAGIGHRGDPIYQEFLATFVQRLGGTPLFWTLVAVVAFYGYAALRRVPFALGHLTAGLALLAFVSPGSLGGGDLVSPQQPPIAALALLQLALGIARRSAWHSLLGGVGLAIAVTLALPEGAGTVPWRGAVAGHLVVLAVLIVGAVFKDDAGQLLRAAGSVLVFLACIAVSLGGLTIAAAQLPWWVVFYPPVLAGLLAGYGGLLRCRFAYVLAALAGAIWLATTGWRGYAALRQIVSGLDPMALGLAAFILAVLISLGKSGMLSRWRWVRTDREPTR
jgi:hypothetical protein